jgi:putative phage-type endonuclease
VTYLLNKQQPEQRSSAWYALRKGMFTASSDIGIITGLAYDCKKNKSPEGQAHLLDILTLKKNGHDLKGFKGNDVTRWGQKYEEIVSKIYEVKTNQKMIEFGLIQHDDYSFVGASPDGISERGIMLEIKCPQLRKITGTIPEYYWSQVQVQLEVCDLDQCDFAEGVFEEFHDIDEIINGQYEYTGLIGEMYECKCNNGTTECKCYDDVDNRAFIYPNISNTHSKQAKEIKKTYERKYITTLKFKRIIYWGLKEYSCITVERDRDWWAKSIPKISAAWDTVLSYRGNPSAIQELLKKTTGVMNRAASNNHYLVQPLSYCFNDTDEDSD